MLLRKRVWDIMREDVPRIQEDDGLAKLIDLLNQGQKKTPELNFVLVEDRKGGFAGVVSMWNIIQAIGPCLLKDSSSLSEEINWDEAFVNACRACTQVAIGDVMQRDVPRVKPQDTLAKVMEIFIDYRRGRAVVEEGGKIIGVVLLYDLYKVVSEDAHTW